MRSHRGAAVVVALLVAAAATDADANPAEVFGFGSRQAACAGAAAATADDFSAAYYNPAGLAFGARKRFAVGVLAAHSRLRIDDRAYDIAEPVGFVIGASTPAPLGGPLADRIHVGLGLFVLPRTLARVIARYPDEPFFPYYDNRTQRLVVLPAIAVRVRPDLGVGVGVNFLATLDGRVAASEGATRALEARVNEEVPSVARLHAGVRWRPGGGVNLALAFRQDFSIPFSTQARTEVAGEPIDIDLSADGLYTPLQVVAGAAWRRGDGRVAADVTWARWSAYDGPFVRVNSALPLVGALAGDLPEVPFEDTWGARLGVERVLAFAGAAWALRGGYGFESSPVPATQTGVTNLLDGPKHTVALGAGVSLPRALGAGELRIDVHGQAQVLGGRELAKRLYSEEEGDYDPFTSLRDESSGLDGVQVSNPGYPGLRSSGAVLSFGLTAEVVF